MNDDDDIKMKSSFLTNDQPRTIDKHVYDIIHLTKRTKGWSLRFLLLRRRRRRRQRLRCARLFRREIFLRMFERNQFANVVLFILSTSWSIEMKARRMNFSIFFFAAREINCLKCSISWWKGKRKYFRVIWFEIQRGEKRRKLNRCLSM